MVYVTRASFLKSAIVSSLATSFLSHRPTGKEYSAYAPAANFVREEITQIIQNKDPSLAGSILRLSFHDATVRSVASDPSIGGADGSIRYELDWSENRGLSKPFKVVTDIFESQKLIFDMGNCGNQDAAHMAVTGACRSLSFADTLALSGAAAVEAARGPHIGVRLGRKDSFHADNRLLDHAIQRFKEYPLGERSTITTSLPSAGLDSLGLRVYFNRLGLTEQELVALSGAHDLGRHVTLLGMPKECLRNLTRTCLEDAPVLAPFITSDPDTLSNQYFKTMLRWNDRDIEMGEAAFIPTDVALVVDEGLKKHVVSFAKNEKLFFQHFRSAYQKIVDSTASTTSRF